MAKSTAVGDEIHGSSEVIVIRHPFQFRIGHKHLEGTDPEIEGLGNLFNLRGWVKECSVNSKVEVGFLETFLLILLDRVDQFHSRFGIGEMDERGCPSKGSRAKESPPISSS